MIDKIMVPLYDRNSMNDNQRASQATNGASASVQHPQQIQVNSTIDADIVLRRVIEDRAAILALKSKAAKNEADLMKAKSRQLDITKILDSQDSEIASLTSKAKRELVEYNQMSKQYIRSFMYAFEKGDLDKLPRHPFAPPLEQLEQAINRRKATLIEKVQADDRVKKLEYINSQEKVTMKVMKKNEEAFLRAIEISKEKFSDSCGSWLSRVNRMLSAMPHHSRKFNDMEKTHVMTKQATQAQTVNQHSSTASYAVAPRVHRGLPQYNDRHNSNKLLPARRIEPVSPEAPRKRPIQLGNPMSPEVRPAKRLAGNFRPMVGTGLGATKYSGTKVEENSKVVHRPKPLSKIIDLCPSPVSSRESDELLTRDFLRRWNAGNASYGDSSPKTPSPKTPSNNNSGDEDMNDIAKVLADLHDVKDKDMTETPVAHGSEFADPGI